MRWGLVVLILVAGTLGADTFRPTGCFSSTPNDSCDGTSWSFYVNGALHLEWSAATAGVHDVSVKYGTLSGGTCTIDKETFPITSGSASDTDREVNVYGLLPSTDYCIQTFNDYDDDNVVDAGEWIPCTSTTALVSGFLTCDHWTSADVPPVLTTPAHSTVTPAAPTHSHAGLTPPAIGNDADVSTCAALNTRWDAIRSAAEAAGTGTVYGINITADIGRCPRTGSPRWDIRTTNAETRGHEWVVRCATQTLPAGATPSPLWPGQCATLVPNVTDDITGLGLETGDGFILGDYCQESIYIDDCPTVHFDGIGVSQPSRDEAPYVRQSISSYASGTYTLGGDPGLTTSQRIAINAGDDCRSDGVWEVSSGDSTLTLRDGTPTVSSDAACAGGTITMTPGWRLDTCSAITGGVRCTTNDKDDVATAHGIPDYYGLSATLSGSTATVTVNPNEGYRDTVRAHVRNGNFIEVTGTTAGACDGIYWRSGGTSLAWTLTDAATGSAADFSGCASGTVRRLNGFNVLFTDGTRATFPVRVAGVDADKIEILDPTSRISSRTPEWVRTAHIGVNLALLYLAGGSGHTVERMLIDGQAPDWRADNAIHLVTADEVRLAGVMARRYGYMEAWDPITSLSQHEIWSNAEQYNRCMFLTKATDIKATGLTCTESWGFGLYNDDPDANLYSEHLTFERLVATNPSWLFPGAADSNGLSINSRGFVVELKDFDRFEIDGAYVRRPGAVASTPNAGRFVISPRASGSYLARNRDVRFANIQLAQAAAGFQLNGDNTGALRRHDPLRRIQYTNIAVRDLDESVYSVHTNTAFGTSAFGWFFGDFGGAQDVSFDQITLLDAQAGEPRWINRRWDRIGRLSIADSVMFLNGAETISREADTDPCDTSGQVNQDLWDCAYPDGTLSTVTVLGCVENGLSGTYSTDRAATSQVTATEATARTPTGTSLSFPGTTTSCDSKEAAEFTTAGSWLSASGRGFSVPEYRAAMGLIQNLVVTSPASGALRFSYTVNNADVEGGVRVYACKDSGGSSCSTAADFDLVQSRSGTVLDSDVDSSASGARQIDVTGVGSGLKVFMLSAGQDFRIGVATAQ